MYKGHNKREQVSYAAKGHVNTIPKQKLAFILSRCHIQEGVADGRQTFDILKTTRQKPSLFSTKFSKSIRKQMNANIIQVKVLF